MSECLGILLEIIVIYVFLFYNTIGTDILYLQTNLLTIQ